MQRRGITTFFCSGVLFALTGCGFLQARMESAAYFSVASAGYAGRFRIAHERWPASVDELEEFMCMAGRADRFQLTRRTCDDVVAWPYRTVLTPEGAHLRIRYFNRSSGELVCNLQVQAPPAGARSDTFPKIIINTTVFSCAGSGWGTRTAGNSEADIG